MRFSFLGILLSFALGVHGMEIHGHRGSGDIGEGNTLPAFQAALDQGADVIELDLSLTRDGIFIIHHDKVINPNVSKEYGGKLIKLITFAEIKKIDPGILALRELVKLVQKNKVRLNLEIKRDPLDPDHTFAAGVIAEKLLQEVRGLGFSERVYYTSFDPEVLVELRKRDAGAILGLLLNEESMKVSDERTHDGLTGIIKLAHEHHFDMVIPEHHLLTKEMKETLQQEGFKVLVWTVNEESRWKELIEMKVDGIITDFPGKLNAFIHSQS